MVLKISKSKNESFSRQNFHFQTSMSIFRPKRVIVIPALDKSEVIYWGWGEFNPLRSILLLISSKFKRITELLFSLKS